MPRATRTHSEIEVMPEDFTPEWTLHPGAMIQREIEAAGYSQTAVAARSNISAKHLNQLLRGHVALSADVAVALERVLGSPGDLWLRMDATWQAAQTRAAAQTRLQGWTDWLSKFPTSVLLERGIWQKGQSATERVDALLTFFGVVSPEAFETALLSPQANYRRSQKFEIDPYSTAVWLRLVEASVEAASLSTPSFSEPLLRRAVDQFPSLTTQAPGVGLAQARHLLSQAGVVLVLEPEIDGTRMCGVSRWSSHGHPVIALTGRQKRLDILWFTLIHEIGHILLHPKRSTFLELDAPGPVRTDDDRDAQETAADNFAADVLVPPKMRSRVKQLRSTVELRALAAEVGVGASIIAGRYGHETKDWRKFGREREGVDVASLLAAMRQ